MTESQGRGDRRPPFPCDDALARLARAVAAASRARAVECALAGAAPERSPADLARHATAVRRTAVSALRLARALAGARVPLHGTAPHADADVRDARRAIARAARLAGRIARAPDAEVVHADARAHAGLTLAAAAAELAAATLRLQSALGVRDVERRQAERSHATRPTPG